jgi:hypothetical protein
MNSLEKLINLAEKIASEKNRWTYYNVKVYNWLESIFGYT